MTDLISRSALWTDIMMIPHNGDIIFSSDVEEAIKDAPVIDAVPVVRCRDCRYAFQNNGHEKEGCPIMDKRVWMDGNGFCSEGARMDEVIDRT